MPICSCDQAMTRKRYVLWRICKKVYGQIAVAQHLCYYKHMHEKMKNMSRLVYVEKVRIIFVGWLVGR